MSRGGHGVRACAAWPERVGGNGVGMRCALPRSAARRCTRADSGGTALAAAMIATLMIAHPMISTGRVGALVLLGALCFGAAALHAAEPNASDTTHPSDNSAEQTAPADGSPEAAPQAERAAEQADKAAGAISAGTVLIGVTMDQVVQARGEPARKEAIHRMPRSGKG